MNYQARASKSAVPTDVSRFLSGSLVQKAYETLYEEPQEKIWQTAILHLFTLFSSFALPAAADHRPYIHHRHIWKDPGFGQNQNRNEVTESLALFSWNSFGKNWRFYKGPNVRKKIGAVYLSWGPRLLVTSLLLIWSVPPFLKFATPLSTNHTGSFLLMGWWGIAKRIEYIYIYVYIYLKKSSS